jgi:hypothetical protein
MPRKTETAARGETIITETPPDRDTYGMDALRQGRERRVRGGPWNTKLVDDLNDKPGGAARAGAVTCRATDT